MVTRGANGASHPNGGSRSRPYVSLKRSRCLASRPAMKQQWEEPAWVATAHGWIADRLGELGLTRTGAIEQPHVREWSTAMRVPTDQGDLWFKANSEVLAFEAGLLELLAEHRPDVV